MMRKVVEMLFVLAMLVPFAIRCDWTYYYWISVTATYLAYITARRWEYE